MTDQTRRSLLRSLGAVAGAGLVPRAADAVRADRAVVEGDPDREAFPQGVASGDPTPSGAVVWTRVSPAAYRAVEPVSVLVSRDPNFRSPVGLFDAGTTGPGRDHTVKADLDGELEAGRPYWYRFQHADRVSPTGRLRTLPRSDSSPDSVSFAVCTCQDYRNGRYGAYRHVANDDVDYILHLGDFVYEHAGGSQFPGRDIRLPSGAGIAMGLEDYRHLHRTYRSDSALQAAFAAHTAIATWDDHEVVNDRFWSYREGRPYAGDDSHPRNGDEAFMRELFAAGIRAWWEYTPARVRYDPDADLLDSLGLYRSFEFGDLLDLVVTDERLFRSAPPDSDLPTPLATSLSDSPRGPDGTPTMFGERQREWFDDQIRASSATWTAWANEVIHMDLQFEVGGESAYSADSWAGYEAEREAVARTLAEAENAVALTGDLHSYAAGYLKPTYGEQAEPGERVGVEFLAPALTSQNVKETLGLPSGRFARSLVERAVQDENPHVEFFDSHHWGYAVVEFEPDAATYTAYEVDKSAPAQNARRSRLARLRAPAGRVALRRS
ncbi:alkaline phosphatase D family protein [Halobacterium litoreum]|uniref:Alkaline phosphatase D family protein n=1 Tax=Halobacterium litoreum TaxID=2039234 RepID=A0ABD5NBG3_9EURY|nr:alkaline phosphatase D family protein [Halobacterium litoreum]UHH14572.1 alkaline phosphatase D family protein [Halobacterium litoreum]